jgi:hypothetical protein
MMEMQMIPYEQVEKMSKVVATSGLFGINKPEQALALMLVAQAEGLHPVTAARDYHIIQGKPTLKSDALLSRFVKSGGKITWIKYTDELVSAKFTHPESGEITVDWDMKRAQKAGLAGKDVWKAYPRSMLKARVISEGVRAIAPWVASGIITKEEAEDVPMPELATAPIETTATVVESVKPETAKRGRPPKAEPEPEPEQSNAPELNTAQDDNVDLFN